MIRHGFVSNSSSSSFVLLVEKQAHERILKEVHPFVSSVVRQVMKPVSMGEQEFFVFHELTIQDYSCAWEQYDDTYEGERLTGPYEAFHEEYSRRLKDGEYLSMTEDD